MGASDKTTWLPGLDHHQPNVHHLDSVHAGRGIVGNTPVRHDSLGEASERKGTRMVEGLAVRLEAYRNAARQHRRAGPFAWARSQYEVKSRPLRVSTTICGAVCTRSNLGELTHG